jgi:6-phosphogluconolactonase/glucosamine-6-phosphate isomerase/deaminase
MGMAEIAAARAIALIATGPDKAPAVRSLRDELVTPQWPCTFLKLCPQADIYVDGTAL